MSDHAVASTQEPASYDRIIYEMPYEKRRERRPVRSGKAASRKPRLR